MGQRAGSKVGAVLDTKNKVKDKANAVKENIKDMPTQTAMTTAIASLRASDMKGQPVTSMAEAMVGKMPGVQV